MMLVKMWGFMIRLFKKRVYCTLVAILLHTATLSPINVVFDMGGVLIETKSSTVCTMIGAPTFLSYLFHLNNPLSLKKRLFSFLATIDPIAPIPYQTGDGTMTCPPIMCNWLQGDADNNAILDLIDQATQNNPAFFHNKQEQTILNNFAHIIFDPELFCSTVSFIDAGVNCVEWCKEQGFKVYILSNWDTNSFNLIHEHYFDFFSQFDGIVISGDIKMIKPNPAIYSYLLESYGLDPEETIFVDDQEVNLEAAHSCGMETIQCTYSRNPFMPWSKKYNFDHIYQELTNFAAASSIA